MPITLSEVTEVGSFTSLTATEGGALTGTWTDLGTVQTIDIDGGTADNVTLGASVAQPATVTVLTVATSADLPSGTTIGDLTLGDGSLVSSAGTLNLGATHLTTTGNITANAATLTSITLAGSDVTGFLDEDTLASNSATAAASQQSIKAYVDNNALVLTNQAEAEAGTENTKAMTALRTAQAINAQATSISLASQAEAEAGTENTKAMTALRTAQAIEAKAQVAFHATAALANNITGNGLPHTALFPTERYDLGGDYNSTTSTFTADRDGIYHFDVNIKVSGITDAASSVLIDLVTSNKTYIYQLDSNAITNAASINDSAFGFSTDCDMDAGDTAWIRFSVFGMASATVDVEPQGSFSGSLIKET